MHTRLVSQVFAWGLMAAVVLWSACGANRTTAGGADASVAADGGGALDGGSGDAPDGGSNPYGTCDPVMIGGGRSCTTAELGSTYTCDTWEKSICCACVLVDGAPEWVCFEKVAVCDQSREPLGGGTCAPVGQAASISPRQGGRICCLCQDAAGGARWQCGRRDVCVGFDAGVGVSCGDATCAPDEVCVTGCCGEVDAGGDPCTPPRRCVRPKVPNPQHCSDFSSDPCPSGQCLDYSSSWTCRCG